MARFILGHRLRALGARNGVAERVLYRLDHAFFSALLWLIRRLSVERASRFGARVGALLGPRFKKSRALDENLRVALPREAPERRAEIAREAWANAGAVMAEYAHLECISRPERLEVEVPTEVRAVVASGQPAIFVTAHQANWDMAGAAIVRLGVPLACVYSPPTNPLLDAVLNQWRMKIGCELIARDESMRPMIRALSAGRSLGIVMDRRVDSGKPVELFGYEKPTTLIPARLALRFGYALVPIRVERLDGPRFRVSFAPPVNAPEGDDEMERSVKMTRDVHHLFEQWIRARPGDWFPSKRLWPKEVYEQVPGEQAAA